MDSSGTKKKGKSIIRDYFELASSDEGKATCGLCGPQLKRKHGNTTNMWTHLKARHPGTHTEADHKRKQVKKVIAFNFFSLFRVSLKLFEVCVDVTDNKKPKTQQPSILSMLHTKLSLSDPRQHISTLFLVRDSER